MTAMSPCTLQLLSPASIVIPSKKGIYPSAHGFPIESGMTCNAPTKATTLPGQEVVLFTNVIRQLFPVRRLSFLPCPLLAGLLQLVKQ